MQFKTTIIHETQLVHDLQKGCPHAFRQLVERFQERVINTCLSFVPNFHDAEDICQEAFIEIYRSIHRFRGDAKLSTWIYRVAVTKSLDHIKAKNRKKRIAFVHSLIGNDNKPLPIQDIFYHPGICLENKERASILFKAIHQLPPKQKAAYLLNKIEGLNYNEVGEVLNLSRSAIESLLFRAKRNLKKLLANYYEQEMKG